MRHSVCGVVLSVIDGAFSVSDVRYGVKQQHQLMKAALTSLPRGVESASLSGIKPQGAPCYRCCRPIAAYMSQTYRWVAGEVGGLGKC